MIYEYLFIIYIIFVHAASCVYKIKQSGDILLTNQQNSLVNVKVVGKDNSFNLELNNLIKFPTNCIPFSTIDYNYKKGKKHPIYYIKHEFKNLIFLYKNNVNVMQIIFPDRLYMVGIGVNNGLILTLTDVDIYRIDTKKKKVLLSAIEPGKYGHILNNRELFYTGIISDSVLNKFFITAAIRNNYYILHIQYNEENETIQIINVIDRVNGQALRVLNDISVVEDVLYITENAENIVKININREKNTFQEKNIYTFNNNDKIIGISTSRHTVYNNNNNNDDDNKNKQGDNTNEVNTSTTIDYVLVNTKKMFKEKPSSEGCLYLLKITNDSVEKYTIIDLFSKDINPFYFSVYDAHISIDDDYKKSGIVEALHKQKRKFLNFDIPSEESETSETSNNNNNNNNNKNNNHVVKIVWTNYYNCNINKGMVDLRHIKIDDESEEKKLPFINITNQYSLAPHISASSYCSRKEKIFNDICYYDSRNNYVSLLNRSEEYNLKYQGNFLFDGYKNYLGFDYKSFKDTHFITYPINNMLYVYLPKGFVTINIPQPYGISIDSKNSSNNNVIVYITGNDDNYNYINKCVIKKSEKEYDCYVVNKKKKEGNELFQYISYISYGDHEEKLSTYIYVTNNKKSIYKLTKQENKWNLEKWFNLDNTSIRIGPIATSLNYFYVQKNVLDDLIKKYPDSTLLSKFKNVNDQDLHITEDGYIFMTLFHTVIFSSNNDAYGNDSGSTIHFYTSILKEKFYQSFGVDSIIYNIENDSKFSYYLS
ncbi:translocon component PTEX88 [Plasmodium gaboni]|uniref:Translocon component PTEX88 n=1 Tax=Plasmodium gaboni TaxID=647221 RepID=A0A151LIM8_9APIC|nr:translocon component PTEX88 [Plasmodium gaboni]KYN98699.1 translocon component PTEX88 [Plasmodium gaboni]